MTDAELEQRLGRERLEALSLKQFGGVMMSEAVYSGRLEADMMFRSEPNPKLPFSGWVFISTEDEDISSEEHGLDLHDCLAILRVAPEVAAYLDLPPGTELIRTGAQTFAPDTEAE